MTAQRAEVACGTRGVTPTLTRPDPLRRSSLRVSIPAALALLAFVSASPARGQVSCSNPDNLCTGNPCVIGKIEVVSPCIVNFGNRTVVIGGVLKVPNAGRLDFQARTIRVEHPIAGRHTSETSGAGAIIELNATGDLIVDRRIDASARSRAGIIVLTAGGNIELNAPVRAKAKGRNSTAPGGTVMAFAMGSLMSLGGGRIEVAGGPSSLGGSASLAGRTKIDLRGRIDARGADGGSITVFSDKGTAVVRRKMEADGRKGVGGTILVNGAQGVVLNKKVLATGRSNGGTVRVTGATALLEGFVRARARTGVGGTVMIATSGDATIERDLTASGVSGGSIDLSSSAGDLQVRGSLDAKAKSGNGGDVQLTAAGDIFVDDVIDVDGGDAGGSVSIQGGDVVTLTASADVLAEGDIGGNVTLDGGSAVIQPGSDLDVDGDVVGGQVRIASSGDLVLSGGFRARGDQGGVIEAQASGNLIADGDFQSDADGCTGLSAGGVLNTADGDFDGPIVTSCP